MLTKTHIQQKILLLLLVMPFYTAAQNLNFKMEQLKNEKVKTAYVDRENIMKKLVIKKGFRSFSNHAVFRYFKHEQVLELWIKPPNAIAYSLLKRYKACGVKGEAGPKKLLGDNVIPEGIYELDMFVPDSPDFLALGINYPNIADINRKSQRDAVSITGGCDTKGNITLDEESLKEVYVIAVEARAAGQEHIPVHIFPAALLDNNMAKLKSMHPQDTYNHELWSSLQTAFNYFNKTKHLPITQATDNGLYAVQTSAGNLLWNPSTDKTQPAVLTASAKSLPKGVTTRGITKPDNKTIAANTYNTVVSTSATQAADGSSLHKVATGETLFSISQKYGVSLGNIRSWNNQWDNNLEIGQALKVSAPPFHTVKKGDTMYSIAKKNKLTVEQLQGLNNMSDFGIKVGDQLRVREG